MAPVTLPDPTKAITFEERALVCADLLLSGRWKRATAARLAELWGVDRGTVGNYRRAGQIVRASLGLDLEEKLEDTLAHLLRMQEENERQAKQCEAAKDYATAAKYRSIALNARQKYAETAGLVQQRVSISLESDPRIAGLWRVLWAALAELDAARVAHLAAVGELTGGAPGTELPMASTVVREAVRRYEAAQGARQGERAGSPVAPASKEGAQVR